MCGLGTVLIYLGSQLYVFLIWTLCDLVFVPQVNGEICRLDDLKAVLLLIEAALPLGSVDDAPEDKHIPLKIRKSERKLWVNNVKKATSALQVSGARFDGYSLKGYMILERETGVSF